MNRDYRYQSDSAWNYLFEILTDKELRLVNNLCRSYDIKNNSLAPLNNKTKQIVLADIFNLDRRKTRSIFNKLKEIGVIAQFTEIDKNLPYTKYWILNPYLSYRNSKIDYKILNLFEQYKISNLDEEEENNRTER